MSCRQRAKWCDGKRFAPDLPQNYGCFEQKRLSSLVITTHSHSIVSEPVNRFNKFASGSLTILPSDIPPEEFA